VSSCTRMSCVNCRESFLEKTAGALCVWLGDETQEVLSVSDTVVRKNVVRLCNHHTRVWG
jgi:hypothetical protein